jgi:hypothetical protein
MPQPIEPLKSIELVRSCAEMPLLRALCSCHTCLLCTTTHKNLDLYKCIDLQTTATMISTSEHWISVKNGSTSSRMIILSRLSSRRSMHSSALSRVYTIDNNIKLLCIDTVTKPAWLVGFTGTSFGTLIELAQYPFQWIISPCNSYIICLSIFIHLFIECWLAS